MVYENSARILDLAEQDGIFIMQEVVDPAERRRLQNRVNQRRYRRRKMLQVHGQKSPSIAMETGIIQRKSQSGGECSKKDLWHLFYSAAGHSTIPCSELGQVAQICHLASRETEQTIPAFERWVASLAAGSPRAEHLLVLVKFNVFQALVNNSRILGLSTDDGMDDEALSPFANPSVAVDEPEKFPAALRPTQLQRQMQHHPWIDLLPIPEMRDNLLLAGDTFDDMELCGDLVGFFCHPTGRTGMIIWGDPWEISKWEVTEEFLRCWGWTIRGCDSIVESTNHWREYRGEEPLDFSKIVWEEVIE